MMKGLGSTMTQKTLPLFLLSLAIISGCGGIKQPIGDPVPRTTPTPVPTSAITEAQVFTNVAQTWNFVDGFTHHMTIAPNPTACAFGSCGDISAWHYTKDSCEGYWNPRTPEQCAVATSLDELYFVLRLDPDGARRCIGFTYIDYLSHKWKVQILARAGQAPPYTIIPASSAIGDLDTAYDAIVQPLAFDADLADFSAINAGVNFSSPWRTDASTEMIGAVNTLVSLQHEGCVTERWNFANGLERVIPVVNIGNGGACVNMDSRFTMVRVH